MGLFDTLGRSWELTKLSWRVLMQDKELFLFPVLSALAAIALFIGIVVPSFILPLFAGGSLEVASYLGLFAWYFAMSLVAIFFQAALVACVKKRLHGGDPTIGYGLREAGRHLLPILGWAAISATVGLVLRILADQAEEKGGIVGLLGQIVVSIVGFAWTLVTLFVVPVMVIEGKGVFDSMKRSAELIRKTWGEHVAMAFGLGAFFTVVYVALVLITLATMFLVPSLFVPVLIIAVVLFATVAIIQSTLSGVFTSVLYSYATGDSVPAEFKAMASHAFVKK